MKPNIINPKCNFVFITYWWGAGNLNKNTERPCLDADYQDFFGDRPAKKGITYDQMIKRWERSCIKNKCNYMAVEYPQFAKKGKYQDAINYKPKFIEDALKACKPRAVVYIDGDMLVNRYPTLFDTPDIDFMAQQRNIDNREYEIYNAKGKYGCFDPFVFETSGGTMYFNNTPKAYQLLNLWDQKSRQNPGKADDRILSLYFTMNDLLLSMAVIYLPREYLWLNLFYSIYMTEKSYKDSQIMISHPECLTEEDTAKDLGAAGDRTPKGYSRYISSKLICDSKHPLYFYEYIHFSSKRARNAHGKYLEWLKNVKFMNIIPYSDKYGKHNKAYKTNQQLKRSVTVSGKDKIVYVSLEEVPQETLIPTITKYLEAGREVVYVPNRKAKSQAFRVVKKGQQNGLNLVANNKNRSTRFYKKIYLLDFDQTRCAYFSPNDTLIHLLNMSRSLGELADNFNSCPDFLCRIRADWFMR